MAKKPGQIRVGIGGWTFEPWRGVFYPQGLPHAQELAYAARQLTTIEINGTFYRTQNPATFRKWASEVPDDFVFSVKGPRYAVNRRVLAEAGDSIARFFDSGVLELGDHLGPLLWQFAPTKKFEHDDLAAFLALLPKSHAGRSLRHVIEPRHPSFCAPEFIDLAREAGVAIVYADHVSYPAIADLTADFVYARLQKGEDTIATAYAADAIETWAKRCQAWARGEDVAELPHVEPSRALPKKPRDVFVYFIHEAKVRAPAAAKALIEAVQT